MKAGKAAALMLFCTLNLFLVPEGRAGDKVTVYAAASATNVVMEIGKIFEDEKGVKVVSSFASSSTLAKQIEAGAPAQVYLSASPAWMDYLEGKNFIEAGSRRDLLGNALVLITPKGRAFPVKMEKGDGLAAAFQGKLVMGDPSHVPAGIYAKEALVYFGWWEALSSRTVLAIDVRSALNFVERGEAAAGIVYATDARLSEKVETTAVFPEESHSPVSYPAALVRGAGGRAREFLDFLSSPRARLIFTNHGFTVK